MFPQHSLKDISVTQKIEKLTTLRNLRLNLVHPQAKDIPFLHHMWLHLKVCIREIHRNKKQLSFYTVNWADSEVIWRVYAVPCRVTDFHSISSRPAVQRVSKHYRRNWRRCARSWEQPRVETATSRPLWTRPNRTTARSQVRDMEMDHNGFQSLKCWTWFFFFFFTVLE